MAVSTTKKSSEPVAAKPKQATAAQITKPEPQSEQMLLELRKVKRYHHMGRLYVADEVYRVSQAEAKDLLKLTFNSRPVFTRYRPKVEEQRAKIQQGPVIRDLTSVGGDDRAALQPTRIPNADRPKAINLDDDPEFLRELQQETDDDQGTGLDDEQEDA